MTEIWHIADDIGARHWLQRDRTVLGQNGFGTGWLENLVRHRDVGTF